MANSMRIYISGPITGTSDYIARFEDAERKLAERFGNPVFNPAKINAALPEGLEYEDYMDMCMHLLDMCDVIYMLKGWRESKGANREYGYALAKDYTILEE